jgi:hypothetical protein
VICLKLYALRKAKRSKPAREILLQGKAGLLFGEVRTDPTHPQTQEIRATTKEDSQGKRS